jgi:choline dehydrogenase-like flavoprotein
MIADLDTLDVSDSSDDPESAGLPRYDLCIVGSGPAGITLANELRGSGLRVCVLESGLQRPTRRGDELRRVVSEGIHIKDWSRERVLGGASTTWAGLSSPLDALDFESRPWLSRSGWPIDRAELERDYSAAAERYRFPVLTAFGPEGFARLKEEGIKQPLWRMIDEKVFLAAGEPQDFGREWTRLFEEPDFDLYLDATLLELEAASEGARIRCGRVRSRSGRELRLRAQAFVLAGGGIENARLLLLSRGLCSAGLGNEHDQVGRCLMNHPKNYHGVLEFDPPVEGLPYYFGCLWQGFAGYAGLRLDPSLQRDSELLNSYVRLEPLFPWTDDAGVEALVTLVKNSRGLFARWKRRHAEELVELRDYSETGDDSERQNARRGPLAAAGDALTTLLHAPKVAHYAYYRLSRAKPRIHRARVRNFMEMEPHPDNRVTLAEERDVNGQPLPRVTHACTALDRRSLISLHEILAMEVERTGFGRLVSELDDEPPWPIDQDASHHMGTTRMGRDPATSVVDLHSRLHTVGNVWIAGASVFPTSGCANPTFTLVALAIRLARRLRTVLGSESQTRDVRLA